MISIRGNDGSLKAMAVAVKPQDIADGSRSEARVNERLILEMAYASEIGIRWTLLSNAHVPEALRANLEICYPLRICRTRSSEIAACLTFARKSRNNLKPESPLAIRLSISLVLLNYLTPLLLLFSTMGSGTG